MRQVWTQTHRRSAPVRTTEMQEMVQWQMCLKGFYCYLYYIQIIVYHIQHPASSCLKYRFFESWGNLFARNWCLFFTLKATANKDSD